MVRTAAIILCIVALVLCKDFYVAEIENAGYNKLNTIKNLPGVDWWIEIGDKLAILGNSLEKMLSAHNIDFSYSQLSKSDHQEFLLLRWREPVTLNAREAQELISHRGYSIFSITEPYTFNVEDVKRLVPSARDPIAMRFEPNTVLLRYTENNENYNKTVSIKNPTIEEMLAELSESRWFSQVTTLANFNRYTYGDDIRNSEEWIIGYLDGIGNGNIQVTSQQYSIGSRQAWNVIARIDGTQNPDDWYILGAHYDSISERPTTLAPGAEDDGSGSAALLEMARVFSNNPPPSTVFLMWFSGEEQGLYGSDFQAGKIVSDGDKNKVKLVMCMDMVAYSVSTTNLRVLLETYRQFAAILDPFIKAAETYTSMGPVATTYSPFGSDHMSFLKRDMPTLLAIDNDWSRYSHYHKTTDTPDKLTKAMATEIIKMNVAAVATVLGYGE